MVEESEAAPMEDGAIPVPPLPVERPTASLDLQRGGLPLSLLRFPGHRRHPFCWQPYGLHDVARYILLLDCILDIAGVTDMSPRVIVQPFGSALWGNE